MDAIEIDQRILPSHPESAGRTLKSRAPNQRKVQSVLYVDDDPDICQVVRASLSLMVGLCVHIAASGTAAIAVAHELVPDLVLMDVMMPGLDGPATLKRMRESTTIAAIPVIFLTAKVLPAEVAHFLQLGAIGVIGKPFDPLKLGDEVLAIWDRAVPPGRGRGANGDQLRVQREVGSLAHSFLKRTRGDVLRLRHMVERACRGESAALQEIGRLAHSIHGSGAMFGYPALSAAAGLIETWLGEATGNFTASGATFDCTSLQPLMGFVQRLAAETDAAGDPVP